MGPSLTLLLLGCFQFVRQHRLCGRSRQLLLGPWGAAGDRILLLATVDWPSLIRRDGGRRGGQCGFSFSTMCRKAEKTHLQSEWGTKKWRREQRRERDGVRVPAFIPFMTLTLTAAQLNTLPWSSRRNPSQLPLDTCRGLNPS